jgi:hypothetical protein
VSLSNEKIYKHSWCVRVRWNPLEHNPSRPVETRRNPFRLTRLNPSKHVTTCRKHVQTCWNTFPVDPMNFLFYIFIFLYFYIFYFIPPPLLLLLHPPQFPHILFLFFWGGGGEGEGKGQGTATAPGGSHHHRRPVAPPKGGGQSPPPFSLKQKTKFTNQTTYVL